MSGAGEENGADRMERIVPENWMSGSGAERSGSGT